MKQDYYVYLHRRNDTNEVFYVGSGRDNRAYSKHSRNKQWKAITDSVEYTVSIVMSNLSKEDAREAETLLIEMYGDQVVNVHKDNTAHDLNSYFDFLNDLFYVNPESQTGLSYKINRYKNKGALSKKAGDVAGKVAVLPNGTYRGYDLKVTFPDGIKRNLQVHRIVWLLSTGSVSGELVIDHIDGNPLNNAIANLREVSHQQNSRNRKPKTDGIPGVYIKQGLQWVASLPHEGKTRIRGFSISKYGNDAAREMAIEARKEFLNEMNKTSEPFSDRHTLLKLE